MTHNEVSKNRQMSVNLTTNEMSNHWRYDYLTVPGDLDKPSYRREFVNPFDGGPISNCLDFWGPQDHWEEIFDVSDLEIKRKSVKKKYTNDKEYEMV